MTISPTLPARSAITDILKSLPAYPQDQLVACVLEHLQQKVPFPLRPATQKLQQDEEIFTEDENFTATLNTAVLFLTGNLQEPDSPDFGYEWEQPSITFVSTSEALAAIAAVLVKESGCLEALNLFEWPKLITVLTDGFVLSGAPVYTEHAEMKLLCLWQLLQAAVKAGAYEQTFELAELVLSLWGQSGILCDVKTLAEILSKLARWVNFIRRGVLASFLTVFSEIAVGNGELGLDLIQADPQGRWARHWLAQTRVRGLLGQRVVEKFETIIKM